MAFDTFADTNLFLDYYLKRDPNWIVVKEIFSLALNGKVNIYTSSSSIVNLMYVLKRKSLPRDQINEVVIHTLSFTKILHSSEECILAAIQSGFTDLEDAVQYYTALSHPGMTHFVTSNIKDFKQSSLLLPVCTPAQFVEQYGQSAT